MNIKDGYIVVPVLFNVVNRPQTCSINTAHINGAFLVKDGAEISLGCTDCLTTQEFTERLFIHAGFTISKK